MNLLTLIMVLVMLLAIVAILVIGHKKASHKSHEHISQKFLNDKQNILTQWGSKTNQDHWLFKTQFPQVIIFEKDAAINHELSLTTRAKAMYDSALK